LGLHIHVDWINLAEELPFKEESKTIPNNLTDTEENRRSRKTN